MTNTDRPDEDSQPKLTARSAGRGRELVPDAVAERATSARQRVATTIEHSRLVALGAKCRRYVTSSYLYRWLTKEPDPEVIVIDLREIRTVGPIIRLLDAAIERLLPIWRNSRAKVLIEDINAETQETPLRVGGAALAAAVLVHLLFTLVTQSFALSSAIIPVGLLAVAALGIRSSTTLEELLDTGTVQFLIRAFEPPQPPERTEPSDGDRSDDLQ